MTLRTACRRGGNALLLKHYGYMNELRKQQKWAVVRCLFTAVRSGRRCGSQAFPEMPSSG